MSSDQASSASSAGGSQRKKQTISRTISTSNVFSKFKRSATFRSRSIQSDNFSPVFGSPLLDIINFQRAIVHRWATEGGPPVVPPSDYPRVEKKGSLRAPKTLSQSSPNLRDAANAASVRAKLPIELSSSDRRTIRRYVRHAWVPVVIREAMADILARGLDQEGLFRVSGVSQDCELARNMYNNAGISMSLSEAPPLDSRDSLPPNSPIRLLDDTTGDAVHSAASLFKQYLRDLPAPLLTEERYFSWVSVVGRSYSDPEAMSEAQAVLKRTMTGLPAENRVLLRVLLSFLHFVQMHSDKNKMTPSNLGICFAPNMIRHPEVDLPPDAIINASEKQKMLTVELIEEAMALLEIDDSVFSKSVASFLEILDADPSVKEDIEFIEETIIAARRFQACASSESDLSLASMGGSYEPPSFLGTVESKSPTSKSYASATVRLRLTEQRVLAGRPENIEDMTLDQLRAEKIALKQEVRRFDKDFMEDHGRAARKDEKQPLRGLLQRYKAVGRQIGLVERRADTEVTLPESRRRGRKPREHRTHRRQPSGERHNLSSKPSHERRPHDNPDHHRRHRRHRHQRHYKEPTPESELTTVATALEESTNDSTDDELPRVTNSSCSSSSDNISGSSSSSDDEPLPEVVPVNGVQILSEQELRKLHEEKKSLQVQLHSFQVKFESEHGRPVTEAADYAPIDAVFQRYSKLKEMLASTDVKVADRFGLKLR